MMEPLETFVWGWSGGGVKSYFKDCLKQSKITFITAFGCVLVKLPDLSNNGMPESKKK
jgi:hypothetical protein